MGTDQRIVQAALEVMSTTRVETLTVRDIAAKAGVNVATVHYYFRTKEGVISEALRQFFAPVMAYLQQTLSQDLPPKEKLLGFLLAYTNQFHRHPGVFISLIDAIVASSLYEPEQAPNAYQKVLLEVVGNAKHRLLGLVQAVSGSEAGEQLVFKTIRMMTSVLHPMLISTLPRSLFEVDFGNEATRERYLRTIIDSL